MPTHHVFIAPCSDPAGHNVYVAEATKTGGDNRVLYCGTCGQAVPLSVAIARTPTPTVTNWTFTATAADDTLSTLVREVRS